MTDNSKQPVIACHPEAYYKIPEQTPTEINTEVLQTILNRASSVISLLEDNGGDPTKGEFMLNHEDVMHALDCVSGLIEQANAIVEHSYGFYS